MESSKHRRNARVVGYVDLVLTSMMLWFPVVMFFVAVGFTTLSASPKLQQDLVKEVNKKNQGSSLFVDEQRPTVSAKDVQDATTATSVIMWIAFVILVLIIGIQIAAAVKLINATQIGKQPAEAARLARYWRTVTWVFTVVSIVLAIFQAIMPLIFIGYVIEIALRFVALYIVQQFITEADMAALNTLPTRSVRSGGSSSNVAVIGSVSANTYPSGGISIPLGHKETVPYGPLVEIDSPGNKYAPPRYDDITK